MHHKHPVRAQEEEFFIKTTQKRFTGSPCEADVKEMVVCWTGSVCLPSLSLRAELDKNK